MPIPNKLSALRTAVIYQAAPPAPIGGIVKPSKPGGYRDSSADIAYCLQQAGENVITPSSSPDPKVDTDWCFPDTEQGVLSAIKAGANVLWANTTLHSKHSLVTLREKVPEGIRFVGQNPIDTEKYEDKAYTNKWLERGELAGKFPKSWLIAKHEAGRLEEIQVPAVLKPIRGRGSHGVVMVGDKSELIKRAEILWAESDAILAESYLAAEEITITVMPPGEYEDVGTKSNHWALPVIQRFDQHNGIAPYNGIVPVSANSRALSKAEHEADHHYADIQRWVEIAAGRVGAWAPMRIDCRRQVEGGPFFLFDVNMKPNATGPGRPGRDDQASLVLMAAQAIGWNFTKLARNVVAQAKAIKDIR